MSATVVVNIEGLDELERDFTEGSKRTVRKFLQRVEKRAAKILKTALSEEAPYDTGKLSEEIHIQTVSDTSNGALTVRVGPSKDAFYGMFQEFGTIHVPAQHWMEETAKEHEDEVLQEYMDAVTDGLQQMKKD